MRPIIALPLAASLLLALPAAAADHADDHPEDSGKARQPRRAYHLTPGPDGVDCNLRVGPRDRVAQDADLVLAEGADVEDALALRSSVVVKRGARVRKAVAAGGSVVVEDGGVVEKEAVALSGDVRVERGGQVGGDAVSLGGQVHIARGGQVRGDVLSLSLQLSGFSLAERLLDGLLEKGPCRVEIDRP